MDLIGQNAFKCLKIWEMRMFALNGKEIFQMRPSVYYLSEILTHYCKQ